MSAAIIPFKFPYESLLSEATSGRQKEDHQHSMSAHLPSILTYLENVNNSESFDRGTEALCSYFTDNLENIEVMTRAETSFSEVERIYKIFHPRFIQKSCLDFDAFLSELCITIMNAKVEQKIQIQNFFYGPQTKDEVAIAKIKNLSDIIKTLEGNKVMFTSVLFRRKLRSVVEEEIDSFQQSLKKKEITQEVMAASLKLHDCLDALFREMSLSFF